MSRPGTGGRVESGLTAALVDGLSSAALGEDIQAETRRALLDVLGTAVGAARSPAVGAVLEHASRYGGRRIAAIPGRLERADLHYAAIAIGVAAHLDDFDDTHLETRIHPTAPIVAAVLPLAFARSATGATTLRAITLGCEATLRVGAGISPWQYDAGWDVTGTCGVLGAALGAGVVTGLDAEQLHTALGIAASSTVGMREAFGTMTRSFNPGRAAANGVLAALLAERGFTASPTVLEAHSGFLEVVAGRSQPTRITDRIGKRWELLANTHKPYPCAILSNPAIEAALALHTRFDDSAQIESVSVRCHPLVTELTSNPEPRDGLEARLSTVHGVAVGLLDGQAGLPQYTDERACADDAIAMRRRTRLEVDYNMPADAACVRIVLCDGSTIEEAVEHARGSKARPLTDDDVFGKVRALIDPVLPGRADAIRAAVAGLQEARDLSVLVAALTPEIAA